MALNAQPYEKGSAGSRSAALFLVLLLYSQKTLWAVLLTAATACLARGRQSIGDVKMLHKMVVRICQGALKSLYIPLGGQYGANVSSMHTVLPQ